MPRSGGRRARRTFATFGREGVGALFGAVVGTALLAASVALFRTPAIGPFAVAAYGLAGILAFPVLVTLLQRGCARVRLRLARPQVVLAVPLWLPTLGAVVGIRLAHAAPEAQLAGAAAGFAVAGAAAIVAAITVAAQVF